MNQLKQAARQAIALLGPEAPLCSGCEYEWNQAIKVLKEALEAAPTGDVVVTKNEAGQIVAVTRQDEDHRILSVIAMSGPTLQVGDTTPEMYSADAKERKNAVEALNKLFRGADQKSAAAAQEPAIWPRNATEVRQFMNANCEVEQYAVGPDTPDDNDRYQLTAHDFLGAVEWWTGYQSDSSHRPGNQQPEHDEDLLEQLYWEFDHQRQKTGEERMAFKGKMRFYASEVFKKAHGIGEAAE